MIEISDSFPRSGTLGKRYPRVYQAESIADMQQGRSEQAKGIYSRAGIIPSLSFGSQPHGLASEEITAVIYLPEVQHYPAIDPKDDIKRLGGATIYDNLGMRLTDKSDLKGILSWYHERSFLDFPFLTSFNGIDPFGNAIFNKNRWKAYRDVSWKLPVVLLAQYTALSRDELKQLKADGVALDDYYKPVTEQYWLLHVFDPEGIVRKRGKERVTTPVKEPIPVFSPVIG